MIKWIYVAARYLVAFLIITYGFAKLNGSQFNILDSELDKPMGQVEGFWLTWYYFGYSSVYGNFIALTQVLGGVLLMFRRTTLLGSCLLIPVIGNIILIDIFYRVHVDALMVALIILGALLFILSQHRRELLDVFWVRQDPALSGPQRSPNLRVAKAVLCVLIILVPAAMTYLVANYNNRRPTPLDGTWDLVANSAGVNVAGAPPVIFFEHNVAYLVVFKYGPQKYEDHHFEVERGTRTVTIWKTWLSKGEKMFEGTYELSGAELSLRGHFDQEKESTLRWTRRR